MKRFILIALAILGIIVQGGIVYGFGFNHGSSLVLESQSTPSPTPTPVDNRAQLTVDNCMIRFNEARISANLPQVRVIDSMNQAAQQRAQEISLDTANYNHELLRQGQASGKYAKHWGEIMTNRATCTEAITSFLESPTHKDIMLSPNLKTIGIGIQDEIIAILVSATKE